MHSRLFSGCILIFFAFFHPVQTRACDCKDSLTGDSIIAKADLIFTGVAVDVKTNWMSGGWKATFRVAETWKNRADRYLIIDSGWEKDCGFLFEPGGEYLVYANRKYNSYKTGKCAGTKRVSDASSDLILLGPGAAPASSGVSGRLTVILLIAAFASLGLVGFIVLRKKFRKNRD